MGTDELEKTISPMEAAGGILKTAASLVASVENAPQVIFNHETEPSL